MDSERYIGAVARAVHILGKYYITVGSRKAVSKMRVRYYDLCNKVAARGKANNKGSPAICPGRVLRDYGARGARNSPRSD